MHALARLSPEIRQYLLVTGNYWAFTLTDGALRMLVVLHFHSLGYTPLQLAALFLFYEIFGVVTNLVGGYLGARLGLNRTMNLGLGMQVLALGLVGEIIIFAHSRRMKQYSVRSVIRHEEPTTEKDPPVRPRVVGGRTVE